MKRKSPPAPSRGARRSQVAAEEEAEEDAGAGAGAGASAPFFSLDALSAQYLVTDFTESKQGDASDLVEAALSHGVTMAQIGKFQKVRLAPNSSRRHCCQLRLCE